MKTNIFHKVGFQLKKHSPEILVLAGIVGVVASTVMACRASTKVGDILTKTKEDVDAVHRVSEEAQKVGEEYTPEDARKDLTIIYTQTGMKLAKLYWPAVGLGLLSIACVLSSHRILSRRNAALAAAYATIDTSFKVYRKNVKERFGEDMDRELRHNIKAAVIEEVVVDEKGKEKTVKKTVNVPELDMTSDYARFFDDGCTGWEKNAEYNLMFLRAQQQQATDLLRAHGYLLLNEVYTLLGIPKTKAGCVVGWVYDEENPSGDNYVDFGIYSLYNQKAREFVNGYERTILLDFNVDGYILDRAVSKKLLAM